MTLHLCRVVLIRPHYAGNLGATARVMRNLGLEDLVLVAPVADRNDRAARQMSTHGEDILDRARVVPNLGEAVADCVVVAGAASSKGGLFRKQSAGPPEEMLPHVAEALRGHHPAALIFGPEPTGLTNEEVSRCHYLIEIPTAEAYPSLNLAQAVAICLYELRNLWLKTKTLPAPADSFHGSATFAHQEQLFAQLRQALEKIHFLYGEKSDALMHAIRHLLGKARLTTMEVNVLLGLARQINWYVEHHPAQ